MWPGQFDEIMESIVYVYDNAEELGINKDKIIIAGDGTGATSTYAAALQLASNGRKVGEEYQRNLSKLSLLSKKSTHKLMKLKIGTKILKNNKNCNLWSGPSPTTNTMHQFRFTQLSEIQSFDLEKG